MKIGTVVELLSGGPKMTVDGILGEESISKKLESEYIKNGSSKGDIYCRWFLDGELIEGCFNPETLRESLTKSNE